jgi:hypothetical protein
MNGSSERLDRTYIQSHPPHLPAGRGRQLFPSSLDTGWCISRYWNERRIPLKGTGFVPQPWTHWDSNPGHPPCKGGTLPLSYGPDLLALIVLRCSVGIIRIEPYDRSAQGEVGQVSDLVPVYGGDPAADSPTATLLRLKPPCGAQIRPQSGLIRTPLGCFDGRCVQGAGTYSPRPSETRLLPNPASCGRVSARNPNYDRG